MVFIVQGTIRRFHKIRLENRFLLGISICLQLKISVCFSHLSTLCPDNVASNIITSNNMRVIGERIGHSIH
jgi:hypothetical protein